MSNKVIVLTGASSGIGRVLARQLAARGDKLVLAARREKELRQAAAECGPHALAVAADVTQRAEVERLRDEAVSAYGPIDVWINNAGQGIVRPVLELTDEDFDWMMTVNVKSALYGMQTILPHFKQRRAGHLINVSSFLGKVPLVAFRSAYNAAKHALNALTANLRMDLRAEYPNIHVSLVLPGAVVTEFQANALYRPEGARALPDAQSAEEVAAVMVELIDQPRAEAYTNPDVQLEQVKRYYADVAAFEETLRGR